MTLAAVRGHTIRDTGGRTWSPASLSKDALWAWWRADTIGQADASSVTSWAPKVGNNTLVTGLAAPIYHTSGATQAINSQPVVSFTGTQSLKVVGPTNIPAASPLTCIVVFRPNNVAAVQTIFEYAGASSKGWGVQVDAASHAQVIAYGGSAQGVTGMTSGTAYVHMAKITGSTGQVSLNMLQNAPTGSVGTIAAGATQVNVGANLAGAQALSADIAEILVLSQPTTADLRNVARYIWTRYGIKTGSQWEPASPIAWGTGNYDGSGDALEVDVFYDPTLAAGHPYWLTYIPNATNEDPSVLYGDSPTGPFTAPLTNPIVAHRGAGTNADPHIRLQPDGNWYVYYQVEQDPTTANNGTFAKSTADPRVGPWSAAVDVIGTMNLAGHVREGEAVAVWDGVGYRLFGAWKNNTMSVSARSSSPLGPFGTFTDLVYTIPGGRTLGNEGEFDVRLNAAGTHFILCLADNEAPHNLWFASSPVSDGVNFTMKPYPVIVPGFGWDGSTYRPSFCPDPANGVYKLWYSSSTPSRSLGYINLDPTEVEP